jgi:hypothetical protein
MQSVQETASEDLKWPLSDFNASPTGDPTHFE